MGYTHVINKNSMTRLIGLLSHKNGLLGICAGLLMLLPACGPRKLWVPEQLTKSNAQYMSEQDGVTLAVRRLKEKESLALFYGRGRYLFKKPFRNGPRFQNKGVRALLVQVTNNCHNSIQLSRNGLNVNTLGSDEVYAAICKNPISRGCLGGIGVFAAMVYCFPPIIIYGFPLAIGLLPLIPAVIGGGIMGGITGAYVSSENKDIADGTHEVILDQDITILPNQTIKVLVAVTPYHVGKFELVIPDLGSDQMVKAIRKFEVNLETKSL